MGSLNIYIFQFDMANIPVQEGWNFAFQWDEYGVVSYNWLEWDESDLSINRNYRGIDSKFLPGEEVELPWDVPRLHSYAYRDYALWVTIECSDETTIPPTTTTTGDHYFLLFLE